MGFIPREELRWRELRQALLRTDFTPGEEIEAKELKLPLCEKSEPNYMLPELSENFKPNYKL